MSVRSRWVFRAGAGEGVFGGARYTRPQARQTGGRVLHYGKTFLALYRAAPPSTTIVVPVPVDLNASCTGSPDIYKVKSRGPRTNTRATWSGAMKGSTERCPLLNSSKTAYRHLWVKCEQGKWAKALAEEIAIVVAQQRDEETLHALAHAEAVETKTGKPTRAGQLACAGSLQPLLAGLLVDPASW